MEFRAARALLDKDAKLLLEKLIEAFAPVKEDGSKDKENNRY
jgi:hypothetical protein